MRVLQGPPSDWLKPTGSTSLTIGVLDGVHFGHMELLSRLDAGLVSSVVTFDPHPVEVLRPGTQPRLITTANERVALFERAGVEQVAILDLAEIRHLSPEQFVEQVLVERLALRHLVVGADFRFGKNRAGDAGLLRLLGRRHEFDVETVPLIASGEVRASSTKPPISSSRIRTEIEAGHLETVASMMPTRFSLTNLVVQGDERGRAIGFPTANLHPPDRKVIPALGVYAAFAHVGGETHSAAVNVGVRPTFGGGDLLVEAYLVDFDGDLYGKPLTVEFVEYLRSELKFDKVDDLVERMQDDVARAIGVLSAVAPSVS